MRKCCDQIKAHLPPESENWLQIADSYHHGLSDLETLTATRVQAWKHLDNRSGDFRARDVNAVRAVICLLYREEPNEDWIDVLDCFFCFCDGVEDFTSYQYSVLKELFADILPAGNSA